MKKLLAIVCAVMMLFSFAQPAFAATKETETSLDFMKMDYTSYEGTSEFYVELNKPLDFLSVLNADAGFDVQYLVESLLKTKINAKVQAETSSNNKAAKVYMALNPVIPVEFSEDLKFLADLTGKMWIEIDGTSVENAACKIVVQNPLNGEYIYVDAFDAVLTGVEDNTEMKQQIVDAMSTVDMTSYDDATADLIKVYEKYATVEKNGEYVVLKFTNDAFVDTIFEVFEIIFSLEEMQASLEESGLSLETMGITKENIPAIKTMIKGMGIFSDNDAVVLKYKLDKNNYLVESEERIRVDFNIFDVAEALGAAEEDLYPLTRDVADIDMTFITKNTFDKVNEANVVQMPNLTEENSTSLAELIYDEYELNDDYYYEDDYWADYQPEKFWNFTSGKMERGGMYVDIEEFFDSAYYDEDSLTGTAVLGENGDVKIDFTSDNFGTVTVNGNIREDAYKLNDIDLWGRKPFITVSEYNWSTYAADEKIYVHIDVLNYILGAQVESMEIYLLDDNGMSLTEPEYYFDIVRPNPAYVAPTDEDISFMDAAAIGVIGGADGPTEVFVTE
ncbi:MAG: hypothetical protein IJ316_01595 [Clostridia bacterium]|nr:hypothetical protein [Clostridia bacterium]